MFDLLSACFLLVIIFQISCIGGLIITFKNYHKRTKWKNYLFYSFLINLGLVFGMLVTDSPPAPKPQVKIIKKTVGSQQLTKAKKTYAHLLAQQEKLVATSQALAKQIDQAKQQTSSQTASSSSQTSVNQTTNNATAATTSSQANNNATAATTSSQATINTAEQQKIIGNKNSKIYHTPDQAGYNILPKNAVYFNSEQEAIAAGYRKAKR